MKVQKVSIGALIFARLDLPDWAVKKLRYWPLILALAGFTLTLGPGIGVPVKVKAEAPFIEWEKPKAGEATPPINGRAVTVGLGLMLIGLIFGVPAIPATDTEKDEHWPRHKADDSPAEPVVFLESPLHADAGQISKMLSQFGRQWPTATVRWPKSSKRLVDESDALSKLGHTLDLSQTQVLAVFKALPQITREAENLRSRFALAIPDIIARCQTFDDEKLIGILQSYLVRANYRAHRRVHEALQTMQKVAKDAEIPKAWGLFANRQSTASALFDVSHTSELRRGILIGIGDEPVYSRYGSGVEVQAWKAFLSHRVSLDYGSARVLIPEIEAQVAESNGTLPKKYHGDLLFSKIGPIGTWPPGGHSDVSSDDDIVALGETYRARWEQDHPEQSPS